MQILKSDVAIIGGGFGGVAAAISVLEKGLTVIMTEEYPWIGGQVTSQGLCVLDDFNVGEEVGCTRRYTEFRNRVRAYYTKQYELSEFGKIQTHLCPGNARCSHLAAEPIAAYEAIQSWLEPAIESGKLTILTGYKPLKAKRTNDQVDHIVCFETSNPNNQVEINSKFFLDGTEEGSTFPLLNIPYRIGSESKAEFNEPHAPLKANPEAVQSFTFCIIAEFVPGGNFIINKPSKYEFFRDKYKFYYSSAGATRDEPANFLKPKIKKNGTRIVPFWNYRSTVDVTNFMPNQGLNNRAVINVSSNDYMEDNLLENKNQDFILKDARELSAAYLYWLQTEAPRDEGGFGYPEIRPMPEASGSDDGIAQAPYIRESRRLKGLYTVTECDISEDCQPNARAEFFYDSIGLGGYAIDIHDCPKDENVGVWQLAKHYQIPLRSLVCKELKNFAVAGKSISVSHIANGAYRLQPEEWNIGESAGSLAVFCIKNKIEHSALTDKNLLEFQRSIIREGIALYWYEDLAHSDKGFEAAQTLAITSVWPGQNDHLRFDAQRRLDLERKGFLEAIDKIEKTGLDLSEFSEPNQNSHGIRKYDLVTALMKWLDYKNWDWSLHAK